MKIRFPYLRIARVPVALMVAMLFVGASAHAQFSGSLGVGVNSTSNASGTDKSSPDKPMLPSIDLQYRLALSRLNSLTFESLLSPYYSTVSQDNSYFKYDLGATALFYLSEDAAPEAASVKPEVAVIPSQPPPIPKQLPTEHAPEQTATDAVSTAADRLALLSERLDSTDIEVPGVSEDSIDAATDLKDSLSESVLAVANVLDATELTSSVEQVLNEELATDLTLLSSIPLRSSLGDSVRTMIGDIRALLSRALTTPDALPATAVTADPTADSLAKELPPSILRAIKPIEASEPENAPIITLLSASTDIADFSSSDVFPKDDALPKTTTTLATSLSSPILFEEQTNQPTYEAYSYSQFSAQPRLTHYFSDRVSMGLLYGFGSNRFPNDTLYTYNENKFRLDGLVAIGDFLVVGAQFGMNFAHYLHPFDSVLTGPRGRITHVFTESANYSRMVFGAQATLFIGEVTTTSVSASLTHSAALHPYLVNAVLGRSKIGGQASDDPFSYNLSHLGLSLGTQIVWDIEPTFDFVLERREYGTGLLKSTTPGNARTDDGIIISMDVSRLFLFEDRVIGVFDSFTPEVSIGYSKYTSTIKRYSYDDLSTTLFITFGF